MRFVKNIKEREINKERRRFLDMVTKTGASSTLLRACPLLAGTLASRFATAQDATNKRVVFMYLPNGAPNGMWLPGSQNNMNLSTQAYAPVADVTHFREVNMGQGGHGSTFRSMGTYEYSSQNTLDFHLAQNFPLAPYKIIRAGVQAAGYEYFTKEAGQQAVHIEGPANTYDAIFNGTPPAAGDNTYQDVFAMTQRALNRVKGKLGTEEFQRIESHAASLDEIERRITNAADNAGNQSDECANPSVFSGEAGHIVDEGKTTSDIVVSALSCGLTNVATVQLSNDQAGWYDGGRLDEIQDSLNHHNVAHSGNESNTGRMVGLLSQIPAYFIQRLKEVDGPDGQPLINTTLFVQVTDMGDGNHGLASAPFLMASNLPGFGGFSATGGGNHKGFMDSVPGILGLPGTLEA